MSLRTLALAGPSLNHGVLNYIWRISSLSGARTHQLVDKCENSRFERNCNGQGEDRPFFACTLGTLRRFFRLTFGFEA